MTIKNALSKPGITGVIGGTIGGICLILTHRLTTRGPIQISPFPVLLILAILTIALSNKAKITFNDLFFTGILTFGVMTLFLYYYLSVVVNPNAEIGFLGHFVRIGIMVIVGVLSSLLISLIVKSFIK